MERVKSEKLMGYRGFACVSVFLSHCTGLIPTQGSWGDRSINVYGTFRISGMVNEEQGGF